VPIVNLYSTRDLNPKVAAYNEGVLFALNAHLCTCWHYMLYFIHFYRQKHEIERTCLRMTPSTVFASLNKIPPIFTQPSWRSFFYFIFLSRFHFLDLFFSNSSCCKWRPCAIKFWADCTCHPVFSEVVLCLNLIMMFGFHGRAGLSECYGKWVRMQSVGEERNAYRSLCLCLVQCGTKGKMSLIQLYGFLPDFL